jgi:hypothetical protein
LRLFLETVTLMTAQLQFPVPTPVQKPDKRLSGVLHRFLETTTTTMMMVALAQRQQLRQGLVQGGEPHRLEEWLRYLGRMTILQPLLSRANQAEVGQPDNHRLEVSLLCLEMTMRKLVLL